MRKLLLSWDECGCSSHGVLLPHLFAVLRGVYKSRKKDKMTCEWKGKANPCCFKVCGLFKEVGDLWAEIHLFAVLTCSLPVN